MSWSDRRRALAALAAAGLAAGCGFRPVYGVGGSDGAFGTGRLDGVFVDQPPGRAGYYYARALRGKLGRAPSERGALTLETRLAFEERETAITVEDDVTRIAVTGTALWRLVDGPDALADGEARAASSYTTLAAPFAVLRAAEDAERRISEALAARVFLDLAAALETAKRT